MNDQQRAAMLMALESLEESRDDVVECLNNAEEKASWSKVRYLSMAQEFRNQVERHDKAITALREALAQPQKPVFISYDDPLISETIKSDPLYLRGFNDAKEKAAKVCEANAKEWMDGNNDWCRGQVTGSNDCAAAIRSMK